MGLRIEEEMKAVLNTASCDCKWNGMVRMIGRERERERERGVSQTCVRAGNTVRARYDSAEMK